MSTFLWMSMNFCLAAETYSQETFFTIESNNLTVKEVFNKIEKESEYIFFYLDNSVDLNRKVSVKARKEQVSKILDQIFEGTDTHYYISDRQIIISKDEKAAPVSLQQKGQTITGIVKDATGEPVIGANIVEKGTTNGTITDENGNFTLEVGTDQSIQVAYIGMSTVTMSVKDCLKKADQTIVLTESDTKKDVRVVASAPQTVVSDDQTFSVVEQMPEYPGGMRAGLEFMARNLRYPTKAREAGKQGRVIVQFVVREDGSLSDLKCSVRSTRGWMQKPFA